MYYPDFVFSEFTMHADPLGTLAGVRAHGLKALAILACAASIAVHAAEPPAPALVTLVFTACDVNGLPVSDLRAEELSVTDAGKPQHILYHRAAGSADTWPHAVVLLLDQLHTPYLLHARDWEILSQTLGKYPRPGQLYCYLHTTHGALFPIRPIPDSWLEAPLPDTSWTRESFPGFETIASLNRPVPKELLKPTARDSITLSVLQELAERLANVPGPRSLVWYGAPDLRKPLPEDLLNSWETDGGGQVEPLTIYGAGKPHLSLTGVKFDHAGSRLAAASSVGETLVRALTGMQCRYRLSYLPPESNWDGRPHSVRITTTRAGVRIQTRDRYLATRRSDLTADRQSALPDLAALAPFDSTVIRLAQFPGGVTVDADDLLFLDRGGRATVRLLVQAIRFSEDPPHAITDPRVVERTFSEPERKAARREGIRIDLNIPASPLAASTRIVVADLYTGSFGTLTLRPQP